ncbi:hypothetical protein HD806DRAFT_547107 [Xylariaceae sp. AK1471]|nr:hypothetical protein HD806DRAFT_547107 [Xylariaceae sp. AK1471]
MDAAESSRPKFSYGMQLDAANSDLGHHGGPNTNKARPDWLIESTICLGQDLNTSKMELDIIMSILEEMGLRLQTEQDSNPKLTKQIELMSACREYSRSRCHLLRERLRQIQFWSRSGMIGQQVPEKAPEEWRSVDIEWRRWLDEQAHSHTYPSGGDQVSPLEYTSDPLNDVAWRVWGPVPYILNADVWWSDL